MRLDKLNLTWRMAPPCASSSLCFGWRALCLFFSNSAVAAICNYVLMLKFEPCVVTVLASKTCVCLLRMNGSSSTSCEEITGCWSFFAVCCCGGDDDDDSFYITCPKWFTTLFSAAYLFETMNWSTLGSSLTPSWRPSITKAFPFTFTRAVLVALLKEITWLLALFHFDPLVWISCSTGCNQRLYEERKVLLEVNTETATRVFSFFWFSPCTGILQINIVAQNLTPLCDDLCHWH